EYPGPLAIAVALSANPSRWFAHLVVEVGGRADFNSWASFLARVVVERPRFARSDVLGIAVLLVCTVSKSKLQEGILEDFIALPNVSASLRDILRYFTHESAANPGLVLLRITANSPGAIEGISLPTSATMSRSIFHKWKR